MIDIESLPLEDQAALASGGAFFATKAVGTVPAITMADGPHGLRKQNGSTDHLGLSTSVPATCFPPACGLAQSWNPDLVRQVGAALGQECRAEDVQVLLGPAVNLNRSPLGGRSFEYFSADPVLTAALGTAWVTGLQSEGVGASVKHFVANDQETDRQRVSADVDPRPLHEIYLRAFERIVREAKPWTVMTSYNRLNGEYTAQSRFLLTEVLRQRWGFEGVVVSDWGGVTDRVAAAAAGLDLEMPSSGGLTDRALVEAVRGGRLDRAVIATIAKRVAALAERATAAEPLDGYDVDAHHTLARTAAVQSAVLLKNDGDLLPLPVGTRIAVVGQAAVIPRYQGGGSSHTEPTRLDIPLDELRRVAGHDRVTFAPGHGTDHSDADRDAAVTAAAEADVVVVFLALPEQSESEGWDRTGFDLPADQLKLVRAVFAVNPRTIAIIARGGVVVTSPLAALPALIDGALLGQGGGRAIAEILFGVVNPSGHLSETIPARPQDTPAYLSFPGEHGHVRYAEGLFVGHRWYDARDLPVAYPFGHGLSYTTFEYRDLRLQDGDDGIRATITVTNTGNRAGRDVPQFYAGVPTSAVERPPHELKAFASVELEPGAGAEVSVLLRRQDLQYWDRRIEGWTLEPGQYVIDVGASSRDLRLTGSITLEGDHVRLPFTAESTVGELLADPRGAAIVGSAMAGIAAAGSSDDGAPPPMPDDIARIMASFPIGRMVGLTGGAMGPHQIEQLIKALNVDSDPIVEA